MNEDTSSNPRKEWYAEEFPEPDLPPMKSMGEILKRVYQVQAQRYGKAARQIGTHLHLMGTSLAKANERSHYTLWPPRPPENETVREKALRLAKQPHSMASKSGKIFDRNGTPRY